MVYKPCTLCTGGGFSAVEFAKRLWGDIYFYKAKLVIITQCHNIFCVIFLDVHLQRNNLQLTHKEHLLNLSWNLCKLLVCCYGNCHVTSCRYKIFAQTVGDVDTTLPQVLDELGKETIDHVTLI